MGYFAIPFEQFGGLTLSGAADEVGAENAIDLLNVDLSLPGVLRSRDGFAQLAATAYRIFAGAPFYTDTTRRMVVSGVGLHGGGPPVAVAYDGDGSQVTSLNLTGTNATPGPTSFARFGSPSAALLYGVGYHYAKVLKFDGTTFSELTPAGFSLGTFAAVQPADNRLVIGNATGVQFSAKGDPETLTGTDTGSVGLTPGDGEYIRGIVAWGSNVFVFKESKFFVFYGNSVNVDGVSPVFNYRTVSGTGVAPSAWDAACAAPEGVYFLSDTGVYLTTGGAAKRISTPLDPLFAGNLPGTYTGPGLYRQTVLPGNQGRQIAYSQGRLYVALQPTRSPGFHPPPALMVLNTLTGTWSVWTSGTAGSFVFLAPFTASEFVPERLVIGSQTNNYIGILTPGQLTDNGVQIDSWWRSGFYSLSYRTRSGYWRGASEKTLRETLLRGNGTVNVQLSHDYSALDAGDQVALGSSTRPGRRRVALRGANFSHQVASVNGGAWVLQSIAQHIRSVREVGLETSVAP